MCTVAFVRLVRAHPLLLFSVLFSVPSVFQPHGPWHMLFCLHRVYWSVFVPFQRCVWHTVFSVHAHARARAQNEGPLTLDLVHHVTVKL